MTTVLKHALRTPLGKSLLRNRDGPRDTAALRAAGQPHRRAALAQGKLRTAAVPTWACATLPHMRVAVIFGLGCSPKDLRPFQDKSPSDLHWRIGLPATRDEANAILLFGGDGTIHRHLSALVRLALPVLVVPAGSGNDFARALGLRSVRDSLAAWNAFRSGRTNVRSIDLGVVSPLEATAPAPAQFDLARNVLATHYFCSVAGVGLDAEIARRANHLPRWLRGHGGYALSFAPAMFQFAAFPMKIFTASSADSSDTANSQTHWTLHKEQPTILAAFANTSTYGGGMKIAPRAKPDDGLLDVCVIGSVGRFKLARLFPTVYFGGHLGVREVDYFSAPRVRIETEHPLDLYADGEYVCRTPAEIGIERGALRVICVS